MKSGELGRDRVSKAPEVKARDPFNFLAIAGGVALGLGLVAREFASLQLAVMLFVAAIGGMAVLVYGNAPRVLLGLILLDIPLQLDIHLLFQPGAQALGQRVGINVSLTLFCLIGLALDWAVQGANRRRPESVTWSWPTIMLGLYLLFSIVSLVAAGDRMYAFFDLSLMIPAFLVFLYIVTQVRTERSILFVITILVAGLALEGSLMLATSLLGQELTFFRGLGTTVRGGMAEPGVFRRAQGTTGSPIVAGSYIVLVLAPAVGVLLATAPRTLRMVAVAAIPIGGVALLLTLSRGAWMTGFASLLLLGGAAMWYRWLSGRVVGLLALTGLVGFAAFSGPVLRRLLTDDGGSAYSRIPLMRVAFDVIRDHPIFGVGVNNLARVMSDYRIVDYGGEWMYQVHNKYLLVWAETGPLGLLAFSLFLGTTLWCGFRVTAVNDRLWSPIALGFTAAIIANATHMLVDSFTGRLQVQLLWVNAAIIVCIYQLVFTGGIAAPSEPRRARHTALQ